MDPLLITAIGAVVSFGVVVPLRSRRPKIAIRRERRGVRRGFVTVPGHTRQEVKGNVNEGKADNHEQLAGASSPFAQSVTQHSHGSLHMVKVPTKHVAVAPHVSCGVFGWRPQLRPCGPDVDPHPPLDRGADAVLVAAAAVAR